MRFSILGLAAISRRIDQALEMGFVQQVVGGGLGLLQIPAGAHGAEHAAAGGDQIVAPQSGAGLDDPAVVTVVGQFDGPLPLT